MVRIEWCCWRSRFLDARILIRNNFLWIISHIIKYKLSCKNLSVLSITKVLLVSF